MLEIGIMIALGVIAVALVAIIVLLIISLVKKKPAPAPMPAPGYGFLPKPEVEPPIGGTAFAEEYTIQLSDIRHPGQKWKLPIGDEITIGRNPDCTLVLTDSRVSRHHCRISVGKNGLQVINLSETNETKLNGLRVSGDAPLQAGDILKLGHDELRVDFIKSQSGFDSAPQSSSGKYAKPPSSEDTRHFF